MISGLNIGKYQIDISELSKFETYSKHKSILTHLIINTINPRININFDFFNILIIYFLFGKDEGLNIHIFDSNKNDTVSNSLKSIKNMFDIPYFNFNNVDNIYNNDNTMHQTNDHINHQNKRNNNNLKSKSALSP